MIKQKSLYIFRDGYAKNSATINRFLAFIKGFSEIGIITNVVFVRPDENQNKVPYNIDNVTFNYLWEGKKIRKNKYAQYFQQIHWILTFLKNLKRGDNVILFGTAEYFFAFSAFRRINFYHELTEHPDVARNKSSLISIQFHRFYLRLCKNLKGLFVISTSLKEYFVSLGIPENKIHVINMIVDSSRFEFLARTICPEKYIAYCGSIVNKKDGVDVLIKAFNIVKNKIIDLKLFLIGGFPFAEDENINRDLVKIYQLQDRVIFTGEISSDEMPQLLKNAQALVLARPDNIQAKNGFPTKLGEYLLTANPVVITNVGDISLFLKNEESAFIAEPDNEKDIAEKIYTAVMNVDKSKIIGQKGYDVAMQHFNYKIESQKICDVIFNQQF